MLRSNREWKKRGASARSTALCLVLLAALAVAGCSRVQESEVTDGKDMAAAPATAAAADGDELLPCPTPTSTNKPAPALAGDGLTRFASNSPFDVDYKPPVKKAGKQLWAFSCLWEKAPELQVEKWLTDKPDTKGKVVLIEFWATWCGPCRRSIPILNEFKKKYGDDLVVIGISDETEAAVRKMKVPNIEYYSAIDTQARTKDKLGVFGIPHVIVLEPDGYVVWEGFPLLKDYELTEEILEKVINIAKNAPAAD